MKREAVKTAAHKVCKFLSSYKMLCILWLAVGIANLASAQISKVSYLCTWLVLILEMASRALEESIKDKKKDKADVEGQR